MVPFVPIAGTPLESHPTPTPAFMDAILGPLARMLAANGLRAVDVEGGLRQVRGMLGLVDLRAEGLRMIFEPFKPFLACEFQMKFATEFWEKTAAASLRRKVFCDEQKVFEHDDRDAIDDVAIPLVAVSLLGVAADDVVGTVRIHPDDTDADTWWGSRLAVENSYRRLGAVGAGLIRLAVSSAHARGCRRFFVTCKVRMH